MPDVKLLLLLCCKVLFEQWFGWFLCHEGKHVYQGV